LAWPEAAAPEPRPLPHLLPGRVSRRSLPARARDLLKTLAAHRLLLPTAASAVLAAYLLVASWYGVHSRTRSAGAPISVPTAQSSAPQPASAALTTPGIGFARSRMVQKAGSTFPVDVVLTDARNVSAVPAQVSYDPKMLLLLSVTAAGLLSQDQQAVALVQRDDSATGTIHLAASRPPFAPGISGTGGVFTLVFLAKAPGQSNLSVQSEPRDPAMHLVPVKSSQARVIITK